MITWKDVKVWASEGNPEPDRRVNRSEEEWKEVLTDEQFRVARKKGTEARFKGEFCTSFEPGRYNCICCDQALFDSGEKYDSRSGWPSFTQPVKDNSIKYKLDTSFGMTRVEVMCNVCDAHLGHVFPDGPEPSGLRYCINSVSLKKVKENHEA